MNKPAYLIIVLPFLLLLLSELSVFYPQSIYYNSALMAALVIFAFYRLVGRSAGPAGSWQNFIILPLAFLLGTGSFLVLAESRILIQILVALLVVFVWYYFRSVFLFHYEPLSYKSFAIENISVYGGFLSVFFFSSAIFGIQSFLSLPIWAVISALTIFFILVIYQLAWAHKIKLADSGVLICVGSLVLTELAWALFFLPLRFYILGFLLSSAYYAATGLIRHYLLGTLRGREVKAYLGIALFCMVIILLSSQWI